MTSLDEEILHLLNHAGESAVADVIFVSFTLLGMLLVALLVAPLLWAFGRRESSFDLVVSVLITTVLVELIKLLVARERPFEALDGTVQTISFYGLAESSGYSFPSGHATRIFTVAAIVSLNVKYPVKALAFAIAAMVAISRVFLGLHWPTDILAGALLGIAAALAVARLLPGWKPYKSMRTWVVSSLSRIGG